MNNPTVKSMKIIASMKHCMQFAQYFATVQAMRDFLTDDVALWWFVLLFANDHDEPLASNAYARPGGRKSTADERQRVEDDERERTRSGGLASAVPSENVFAIYDEWQRVKEIRTSYDTGEVPSVSYEYFTPQGIEKVGEQKSHSFWYAITKNKVTFDTDDKTVIQTVVQVDGLGRKVRSAKTGVVNGVEGWNASGAVVYDKKSRVIKEGMTEFIEGSLNDLLSKRPSMTEYYKKYEYDAKDRKIKTVLPDTEGKIVEYTVEYLVEESDVLDECELVARTTDPLGNVSEQRTNAQGNIIRVSCEDEGEKELTNASYEYDVLGQMLNAFDAAKNPIGVEYDLLGRRTALQSLDGGR